MPPDAENASEYVVIDVFRVTTLVRPCWPRKFVFFHDSYRLRAFLSGRYSIQR